MFEKNDLFSFCALVGTGLFSIQFIFNFIGSHEDDSSYQFKWLSKQAITGFLMMFGWIGLAAKNELGFSPVASTVLAISAGIFAMFITGSIFRLAKKLRSTGTIFKIDEAIGKEAFVYQRIPKEGSGKISISLGNMTHEIDAISLTGEEVDSFTQVQIVKKANEQTVVIVPHNR